MGACLCPCCYSKEPNHLQLPDSSYSGYSNPRRPLLSQANSARISKKYCYVFVFPNMPGDVNPSLPIARQLVNKGHEVHYIGFHRAAMEDTGAMFHDATLLYPLYNETNPPRKPEIFGAMDQLKQEYGLEESDGEYMVRVKLAFVEREKTLPGVLNLLNELNLEKTVIVYDPVLCPEAALAAECLKLPSVAILAFSGPGAWAALTAAKLENELPQVLTKAARRAVFDKQAKTFKPNLEAIDRLNRNYNLNLKAGYTNGVLEPVPRYCLITGCTEATKHSQREALIQGALRNVYVGPLLDEPGSLRAGGATTKDLWREVSKKMQQRKKGGYIVYVSLGTVTTRDGPLGWQGSPDSSITGEQLCQAAWGAVIDVFGEDDKSVILMTLGKDAENNPRPLKAGDKIPANALAKSSMPQLDLLNKGIDLFVTHGGQNSWVEAVMTGTPMLVLPTVGDQFDNAQKTVDMHIGEKIDRPGRMRSISERRNPEMKDLDEIFSNQDSNQYKPQNDIAAQNYRRTIVNFIKEMLPNLEDYQKNLKLEAPNWVGGGVQEAVYIMEDPNVVDRRQHLRMLESLGT